MLRKILSVIFILGNLAGFECKAQASPDSLHLHHVCNVLEETAKEDSSYNELIDIAVSDMPVKNFLNNIAKAVKLNLDMASVGKEKISCNFKRVPIKDLLFFVCKNYCLDLTKTGTILSVHPCKSPYTEPEISMEYEPWNKRITFNFIQARLDSIARKFTDLSGVNIVVPNSISDSRASAYGKSMPVDDALRSIASANRLEACKKPNGIWTLFRAGGAGVESEYGNLDSSYARALEVDSLGLITVQMKGADVKGVITELCRQLKHDCFFADSLEYSNDIFVEKVDFNSFLNTLFTGTRFTWRVDNGIYLFGKNDQDSQLLSTRVVPMRYRTVDKVMTIIPKDMQQGMEIITFPDLNSLIINGEQRKIFQIITFLREIDKSVPLVSIDVIILDATDTNSREAGVSMGLGEEPAITSGSLSPGVNLSLGASSINKLLNSFNGFGSINLGRVSPDFYFSLKLLEEDGKITLRSTPRLSTLNGHKATLKSGETKYYKEIQTYLTGVQNPIKSESYQWKSIDASLSLDITPYVSLDSCITMQINLSQSEYTEREMEDAPPGTTTRSFNSIIKVQNEEMVLLGGLERSLSSRTSKGLPFLARVPVLRWIFGSSSKNKSTHKLNVFIKPTIIR